METFEIDLASDLAALQKIATEIQVNSMTLPAFGSSSVQFLADGCEICRGPYSEAPILLNSSAGQEYQVVGQSGSWYGLKIPNAEDVGESVAWVDAAIYGQSMNLLTTKGLAKSIVGFTFSTFEWASASLVNRLTEMRERYANSPVRVNGFSVTLGTSFSVDISFEFREPG